jgi:bacterioferritin-associated ferredoxin
MYVCNCNGIREAEVQAVAPSCARPADVFKALECRPKCGQCLDDMRRHIHSADARCRKGPTGPNIRKSMTGRCHEGAKGNR